MGQIQKYTTFCVPPSCWSMSFRSDQYKSKYRNAQIRNTKNTQMFVYQFSAIFCIVNILILKQIQFANTEIRKNTFVFHFSTGLCVVVHFPSDRYRSCSLTLPLPPPKNIYHTIIIHAIYYQKYTLCCAGGILYENVFLAKIC